MTTMLEVISRSSSRFEHILNNHNELFKELKEYIKDKDINEIVFVGSGSSYSSILSSMLFVEKASGIQTFVMLPNLFLTKENYNPKALYVFVSQTGTSSLTTKCAEKLTKNGFNTVGVSGEKDSPVVKNCNCFVEISLGYEEYTYATLGFSCSILTEMLLGMVVGLEKGHINNEQFNEYLNEANKVIESNASTIKRTIDWFNKQKDNLLKAQNFVLYGGTSLWGIANEGALKIMEITKKYVSLGYEMDDGMHGPNYCLDERTVVFALNDGKDNTNAINLMKLMKNEYGTGYMIGRNVMDDKDLELDIKTNNFTNLEIISFVQTLAYLLATEIKVDIFEKSDPRINTTKGKGYFNMHDVK